ncbi:MAG TPA: aminotransferase class V-fold PLP-dependent enzyme [Dermatophilaceae bacterium]|nr:aminotransferase class V-fold PLP-dependent enzyme [Dermatophilaceae bacterium]
MAQQPENERRAAPRRVLLDAGSTPMLPSARATLMAALDAGWADPQRLYTEARRARALLDQARELLADGLGVRPPEVSFLPGGPAALRSGLEGLRYAGRRRGARMVATAVEHSAILTTGRYHAAEADNASLFAEVGVDRVGRVDLPALEDAISAPGTVLAAVQSANGEIGTRQPLERAHELCRTHDIPLLVDAMASLGRDPTPVHFDVLAGDARSWGGPAGLGVLVVPERTRWRRPGPASEVEHGRTDVEPVVAFALAAAEAWRQTQANRVDEAARTAALIQRLRTAAAGLQGVDVVGDPNDRLPHVLTFSVLYVDGEALVTDLDRRGFAVGSGSACTSSTLEPSHVLAAMGVLTHGNVRITLPLNTIAPTLERDVDRFIAELPDAVARVRAQLGASDL